ncbi:MAG: UTP--glucose-1-phosphate uridylyltransferase [Tenericutes bacterium]|nr:UTP--glucose-1-phosphate uridylyltransferase [Mycoplasmatota bacterium]
MKKIKKLVIPVAGMGTRFLPVTKSIPKEMLPIVDIPTVELLLKEAADAGIEEVLFITSRTKNSIIDHFDIDYELEDKLLKNNKINELNKIKDLNKMMKIFSIRQGKPLGSGHAVLLAKSWVGNENFAVMYGDDIIKGGCALKELINVYEKYDSNVIGLQEVKHELTNKYGIVSLEDEESLKINALVEKPKIDEAPSNLAGLGRYILKHEIFQELEDIPKSKNGEYQLTDAMASLMKKQSFHGCKFSGTYYDIGSQLGYIQANIMYALDREELKEQLLEFINQIKK